MSCHRIAFFTFRIGAVTKIKKAKQWETRRPSCARDGGQHNRWRERRYKADGTVGSQCYRSGIQSPFIGRESIFFYWRIAKSHQCSVASVSRSAFDSWSNLGEDTMVSVCRMRSVADRTAETLLGTQASNQLCECAVLDTVQTHQ